MSSRPLTGADWAITTPGSMCDGRAHHAHRVRVGEVAEHDALVLDAVLEARDRDVGRRARVERLARADRVLRLHREDHDVVGGERELRRMVDDRDRERLVVVGRLDAQPAVADRLVVRAARDERDVVAALEQAGADDAADRARAVDDEAHRRGYDASRSRKNASTRSSASLVGWPGWSTSCSVSTECARLLDAVRVAGRRVDLDADEVVAELLLVARPARVGHGPVLREAQPEHAQVRRWRRGPSRGRGRRRRGRARASAALPSGNGIDGWLSTGASISSSTAIASAKPPLKHMPTAPTPGPPACAWRSRASARSHAITGDVRLSAHVANSLRDAHLRERLHDVAARHRLAGLADERRHRDREARVDRRAGRSRRRAA